MRQNVWALHLTVGGQNCSRACSLCSLKNSPLPACCCSHLFLLPPPLQARAEVSGELEELRRQYEALMDAEALARQQLRELQARIALDRTREEAA